MTSSLRLPLLALAMACAPATAFAHVGVGDAHGFGHGFGHPIGGADHVLAMVAVGLFAAFLGRAALCLVPTAFLAMMAVGGFLGVTGVGVPFVEVGVAASVIVLGLAVALQWRMPAAAAMGMVGVFAIFHGYAHGAEMPADVSGLEYAVGFMLATALLHVVGVGLGLAVGRIGARAGRAAFQASGGFMALAGVGILTGYL